MLDKFGNAKKKKCKKDSNFWLLSINSDRVAQWLRRWTANPIQFPCVSSNPIFVGTLLGGDPKLKHAELQAPHSGQQIQCLDNIQFERTAKN